MSVDTARERMNVGMVDRLQITRASTLPATLDGAGRLVPAAATSVYIGRGLVSSRGVAVVPRGGEQERVQAFQVSIPWDAPAPAPGDLVYVTGGVTLTVETVASGNATMTRRRAWCRLVEGSGPPQ